MICHHGARSFQVGMFLERRGFGRLYNFSAASMPERARSIRRWRSIELNKGPTPMKNTKTQARGDRRRRRVRR